jgi:hypothetical protein
MNFYQASITCARGLRSILFSLVFGIIVAVPLFQALILDLEPAMGMDTWKVFGNAVTTNFSCVYSSLVDFGGTIYALKWIWQGCCQQKHKVFFWLMVHNRLNTRAMLQRKG